MRTLVVYCHPEPTSFTAAARDAALDGLMAGRHDVRTIDLYAENFDPVLSLGEHANHLAPPETKPDIATHAEALRWCESIVFVYPTWWSGQPAMLKGWFDRVLVQDVAWTLPEGATRLQPGLRNIRRITVVTSHGSTKFINALEGEAGKRTVTRSLRVLCARSCRTQWIALYNIDRAAEATRTEFLQRVRQKLAT